MGRGYIGEFEELVLLAVCGLPDEAYAVSIQQRIERRARRSATLGGVYRALNRLENKGFVRSRMGQVTHARGGKRKRFYDVTGTGKAAVVALYEARERMWAGLEMKPSLPIA